MQVGGALAGIGNLNITTFSSVINHISTPTSLSIQPGANLVTNGAISINSAGSINVGATGDPTASLTAGTGALLITGHGAINVDAAALSSKTTLALTDTVGAATIALTNASLTSTAGAVSINAPNGITNTAQVTATGAITMFAVRGQINDNGSSYSSSGANVSLTAEGITQDSTTTVSAKTGIALSGLATGVTGTVSLGKSYTDIIGTGSIRIATPGPITVNDTAITAGQLQNAQATGTLGINNVEFKGAVSLISGNSTSSPGSITFSGATPASLISNGANVTLTVLGPAKIAAGTQQVQLGSANLFQANGGSVIILTNGSISGSTGDQFTARSVGLPATATGGGVELGAGTTVSGLASAFALRTIPAVPTFGGLAPNFTNPASSNGAVIVNGTSSNVNLSLLTAPSSIGMNLGAIVFDAKNSQTIQLDNAIFSVAAFKPIAFEYELEPLDASETSKHETFSITPGVFDEGSTTSVEIANILVPGKPGVQVLNACAPNLSGTRALPSSSQSHKNDVSYFITLQSGELFLNPLQAVTIKTPFGEIKAKKNAQLAVSFEDNILRVTALSGPNDVFFSLNDAHVILSPGEELSIANHILKDGEILKPDGVGRRNLKSFSLKNNVQLHATISEISIITMLNNSSHLKALIHSSKQREKFIATRLLKAAAAIDTVTRTKGPYQSMGISKH